MGVGEPLEWILRAYPAYVAVADIPMGDEDDRVALANILYTTGLLIKAPASA